ncbi:Alpha-L-fucosidase [Novipirellula aureliae]|uniref:alpha-L-fucosidase n=1 Tax=Novipirellula aureliae TaxID=2527966 RepID=A0A5C6DD19_9BACT|nr:alpha-L-fucosidase [Novipirellula aureliae]TWU34588.1 Alpha-L-fucosidase [Novipirellula aureliae]
MNTTKQSGCAILQGMKGILLFLSLVVSTTCYAQDEDLSWEALSEQYEVPQWFTDARFGVWVHWGAQSVPEYGGGWYARHMYMQDVGRETFGKNAYPYHLKTFGHPSEVGFKDVIHHWKAENFDADSLLRYFTENLGARYFMALAHHHDNFDNWDSTYQEWNSVNVGPKRDIIGEFSESAKKFGVPFGVTTHDERFFDWNLPAFGADNSGEFKDIPYDGRLTKKDGIGKWWEGFDPANLYGIPPEKRTPEWMEAWKQNWLLRMKELLTKYDPDYLWFDGRGFPYGDYGKEAFRTFYNQSLNEHGKINAVIAGKIPGGDPGIVHDIEQGVESVISAEPWQSICTYTHWFYKKDDELRHDAKSTIQLLIDVVSKNGNFVLNVELLPDGTIPPDHKVILDGFGAWLKLNGDAIYGTSPWKVHGDNLLSRLADADSKNANAANSDLSAAKRSRSKQFNNRTKDSPAYGHEEVRFTVKDDALYMFVLNPSEGEIELPSLGLNSAYRPKPIQSIRLIGSDAEVKFNQSGDTLILEVPANRPTPYAAVFQVEGALDSEQ